MSPVAKQMTSSTVVAKRDIMQWCFVGFSVQSELSCFGCICHISFSLPGCSGLSNDKFCHPKSKNASKNEELYVFWSERGKMSFLRSSHACTREFLALGRALTMLCVAQAYLKRCCFLREAVVVKKPAV